MANTAIADIEKLEELAAWHRINADHAGSAWVWEARLRTAEDLERQATELRTRLLRSPRIGSHSARRDEAARTV
jgi:hypothetical protein